ncbi:MAG: MmgE/PrpD family protein, partial [Candidatus Parvarchaeum sp.]
MLEKSLTEILSEFVLETHYDNLPNFTKKITKLSLLDFFGSTIAGSNTKAGKIFIKTFEDFGCKNGEATIIGNGYKTSVADAAFINGGCCHILELDDIHKASTVHPAAPIIPAALAIAEKLSLNGNGLIEAIVVGYDVAIRIGEAVNPSHYYYWHNTATCGTFGAAAAAGKVLNLTKDELVDALGNAGSIAAGLWEFLRDGAMTKHLHPANAAKNGLTVSTLAKNGFTGAKYILEGEKGFFKAMAKGINKDATTNGLGKKYKIEENGFKLYPSCRHSHPGIDATLKIKEKYNLMPADIEKIKIKTYSAALNIAGNLKPKTSYEAKFSLPYCVAATLIFGKLNLSHFKEEIIADEKIKNLINKIEIEVDKDF